MNVWILFSMIGDILICKFYVVKILVSLTLLHKFYYKIIIN